VMVPRRPNAGYKGREVLAREAAMLPCSSGAERGEVRPSSSAALPVLS
jgi:hypothetical protein